MFQPITVEFQDADLGLNGCFCDLEVCQSRPAHSIRTPGARQVGPHQPEPVQFPPKRCDNKLRTTFMSKVRTGGGFLCSGGGGGGNSSSMVPSAALCASLFKASLSKAAGSGAVGGGCSSSAGCAAFIAALMRAEAAKCAKRSICPDPVGALGAAVVWGVSASDDCKPGVACEACCCLATRAAMTAAACGVNVDGGGVGPIVGAAVPVAPPANACRSATAWGLGAAAGAGPAF